MSIKITLDHEPKKPEPKYKVGQFFLIAGKCLCQLAYSGTKGQENRVVLVNLADGKNCAYAYVVINPLSITADEFAILTAGQPFVMVSVELTTKPYKK